MKNVIFRGRRLQIFFLIYLRPGRSNSRNDPGVWLVYYDSTRRAEHAHIGATSQRVANSGVRALWSWKFWPKISMFSAIMSIFSLLGGVENRKIGNFSFLNPIYGAQRTCKPHCFLLSLKFALAPSDGEKIDIIAETIANFWPKFPTSTSPNFRFCHSLNGLTYMNVFSSTSAIRIS